MSHTVRLRIFEVVGPVTAKAGFISTKNRNCRMLEPRVVGL
jgi:hypothetical protein